MPKQNAEEITALLLATDYIDKIEKGGAGKTCKST